MKKSQSLILFHQNTVRRHWDDNKELWYFSIVDVVSILSGSVDGRNYWKVLKHRLKEEGSEVVTKCNQLKMRAASGSEVYEKIVQLKMWLKSQKRKIFYR